MNANDLRHFRNSRALDRVQAALDDGRSPDVAATIGGFTNGEGRNTARGAAMRLAKRHKRHDLADALQLPSADERRAERIEDLLFLLDVGEWPERALRRTGFGDLDTAHKYLVRYGHADVWERISETVYADYWNSRDAYGEAA